MPRKQNGFGPAKSFSVGSVNSDFNKGRKIQGSGQYPSDRRFGATVTRSAIQQWNIDSTWAQWRKGYEYARQNAWVNLDVLFFAYLFSGTTSRLRANFRCKRFPSLSNDTATRYVVKREIAGSTRDPRYATVTAVLNDPNRYKNNFQNEEIWLNVSPQTDPTVGNVIKRLSHERITNKRHGTDYTTTKTFEATVKTILKNNGRPLVYKCVSKGEDTVFKIKIPRADVLGTDYVKEYGLEGLVGQVIRITNMPITMPKTGVTLVDKPDIVEVQTNMQLTNQQFWIANVTDQNPFEVFIDTSPLLILTGSNAEFEMNQTFFINKSEYQQYFDFLLTASTIDDETEEMSSVYPPLYIADISDDGTNIIFKTIPVEAQLNLYGVDSSPYIVLSDFSFTSWQVQDNGQTWNDTSIFPWQDQTWLVGDGIYMADAYACNCQSYSKSTVTSPESQYRKYTSATALNKNRQLKYPLPSALSNKDIEGLSNAESGVIVNWATRRNRLEYKTCKHAIAGIFAEEEIEITFGDGGGAIPETGGVGAGSNKKYVVLEPNTFPAGGLVEEIENEIVQNTKRVNFSESGPRAEISQIDFAFSTLQLLNLMDTEVGSILGGNVPLIPITTASTMERGIITD